MGSSAQDKSTQQASSAAAQQVSQQQAANATQQQQNSNAAYKTLFGQTDATGKLSGGSVSQFIDPSSLNQSGLNSTYANSYRTAADQNAKQGQNAVSTTLQTLNNRGMGATPAGFAADQIRKNFSDQAASNATNYNTTALQQHTDSLNNYWNANNLLNTFGSGQASAATANNSGADSTNTSLYGTASQQKQSALGATLGAAASLGGAAITKYCWIAEACYGVKAPETWILRHYLTGPFMRSLFGRMVMRLYKAFGQKIAALIYRVPSLGTPFRKMFDLILPRALTWAERECVCLL